MKPLFVLLGTFVISLLLIRLFLDRFDYALAGRIAMCVMLLFTAIGHFAFTRGMAMMVPDFIPFKTAMVYLTGIMEIAGGICLLFAATKTIAAWALIVFFIVLLPGNIKAAIQHIDYEKGTYEGKGLSYLWFRVPLQVVFIVWIYISAIQN